MTQQFSKYWREFIFRALIALFVTPLLTLLVSFVLQLAGYNIEYWPMTVLAYFIAVTLTAIEVHFKWLEQE